MGKRVNREDNSRPSGSYFPYPGLPGSPPESAGEASMSKWFNESTIQWRNDSMIQSLPVVT